MKPSQWLVFGMGAVVAGVTVWHALYGVLPHDLGTIVTGTLLAIGCIVWAFVGLEDKQATNQEGSRSNGQE